MVHTVGRKDQKQGKKNRKMTTGEGNGKPLLNVITA